MINVTEVIETNDMIEKENLDVRTITLGISLLDCITSDLEELNKNIYNNKKRLLQDFVIKPQKRHKFKVGSRC